MASGEIKFWTFILFLLTKSHGIPAFVQTYLHIG